MDGVIASCLAQKEITRSETLEAGAKFLVEKEFGVTICVKGLEIDKFLHRIEKFIVRCGSLC